MKNQLPLSLCSANSISFANYIEGDNQQLLFSLKNKHELFIYLWGEQGAGKSHLLQAACEQYLNAGHTAIYIPLAMNHDFSVELLEGLEMMDLVCLDDIDQVIGDAHWEEALFHFFNKIREQKGRLILAADNSAVNLAIQLADLKSRLSWGLTYQVKLLSDQDKAQAIKLRAQEKGIMMSDDVLNYLLKYSARDMPALMALLEKLDYESLVKQRKLTIPFVKKYL